MMNNNDEDEFAPNPFRSSNNNDFLGAPAPATQPDPFAPQQQQQYPPPQQQQQMYPQQQQQQQLYPPQQQQQPQYNNNNNMNYDANRIDPNSGMTGSLNTFPPPVQQQPPPIQDPGMYLSGTMDQKNAANNNNNNNYGSTGSTSTSLFSLATLLKCCRFDTFTEYFNVDSIDIYCRLKGSIVKFYQPDQFRTSILGDNTTNNNEEQDPALANAAEDDDDADSTNTNNSMMIAGSRRKGPDLYGPFWIATTLMFVLGMTSNLSAYMHHVTSKKKNDDPDSTFEYDINHLLRAMSVVSIMAFVVPIFFWLTCQCLGMPQIKLAMWVCIYGYSFTWLLIGSLVAWWLPYEIYHIVILAITTSLSGLLVIRNLSTPLLSQDAANHAKAAPLLLAILGTHFCFFLALKVLFFT